jgi:hypothetical protein
MTTIREIKQEFKVIGLRLTTIKAIYDNAKEFNILLDGLPASIFWDGFTEMFTIENNTDICEYECGKLVNKMSYSINILHFYI